MKGNLIIEDTPSYIYWGYSSVSKVFAGDTLVWPVDPVLNDIKVLVYIDYEYSGYAMLSAVAGDSVSSDKWVISMESPAVGNTKIKFQPLVYDTNKILHVDHFYVDKSSQLYTAPNGIITFAAQDGANHTIKVYCYSFNNTIKLNLARYDKNDTVDYTTTYELPRETGYSLQTEYGKLTIVNADVDNFRITWTGHGTYANVKYYAKYLGIAGYYSSTTWDANTETIKVNGKLQKSWDAIDVDVVGTVSYVDLEFEVDGVLVDSQRIDDLVNHPFLVTPYGKLWIKDTNISTFTMSWEHNTDAIDDLYYIYNGLYRNGVRLSSKTYILDLLKETTVNTTIRVSMVTYLVKEVHVRIFNNQNLKIDDITAPIDLTSGSSYLGSGRKFTLKFDSQKQFTIDGGSTLYYFKTIDLCGTVYPVKLTRTKLPLEYSRTWTCNTYDIYTVSDQDYVTFKVFTNGADGSYEELTDYLIRLDGSRYYINGNSSIKGQVIGETWCSRTELSKWHDGGIWDADYCLVDGVRQDFSSGYYKYFNITGYPSEIKIHVTSHDLYFCVLSNNAFSIERFKVPLQVGQIMSDRFGEFRIEKVDLDQKKVVMVWTRTDDPTEHFEKITKVVSYNGDAVFYNDKDENGVTDRYKDSVHFTNFSTDPGHGWEISVYLDPFDNLRP